MGERKLTVKWAIDEARKAIDKMEKEYDELIKVADGVSGKVMPVAQCKAMGGVMASVGSYCESRYGVSDGYVFVVSKAKKDADARIENDRETHKKNIPAIENNTRLRQAIASIMSNAGIPATYTTTEYKSNRSRTPTRTTHASGWFTDLDRHAITNDGIEYSERMYADTIKKIEDYVKAEKTKEEEKEKVKEKEKKAADALRELAVFQVRHELPSTSSWDDILDTILSKDKYLRLAHFLYKNRSDWNEGCHYAECGIRGFKTDSEEDQDIVSNISDHIQNWDGDGRIFRDCEWNYDRLFGKVDNKLLNDYNIAREHVDL